MKNRGPPLVKYFLPLLSSFCISSVFFRDFICSGDIHLKNLRKKLPVPSLNDVTILSGRVSNMSAKVAELKVLLDNLSRNLAITVSPKIYSTVRTYFFQYLD